MFPALLTLAPMAMKLVEHSPLGKMMKGGGEKADGEAGSMAPQNPMKMMGGGGMLGGIMGGGGGPGGGLSGISEKVKGFMGM
jgi:hypothetical protein